MAVKNWAVLLSVSDFSNLMPLTVSGIFHRIPRSLQGSLWRYFKTGIVRLSLSVLIAVLFIQDMTSQYMFFRVFADKVRRTGTLCCWLSRCSWVLRSYYSCKTRYAMYEWRNIAARSRNVFTTSAILNTIQLEETAVGVLYVSDDNMIYLSLHVKCLIVVKFWFYRQVFHMSFQYQNSQKSVQWEPRFIHADGQTDRWYMVKLVGVFRDVSSNAATIIRLYGTQKVKLSRYRPEQAHGRSGRLRPRIFLTFGTRRW
jgi:hypothetical protein